MANSTLQVTYRTKKTGTGTQDLNKELKQTGLSLTDLKSGLDLAIGGFQTAVAAVQAFINPTIEAAGKVRELQRTIGASAEEASKLIEAADDVGVSSETLQGALEAAIKRGVEPTIAGIGELADEYNAIEDPIARVKFLQDKFGKSGADLGPLMAKGAAGIKELGDQAVATGKVLSQDAVDAAREYELSVDALEDATAGYITLLAQDAIPVLADINNLLAEGITLTNQLTVARRAGVLTDQEAASVSDAVKYGYFEVGEAAEYVQEKLDKQAAATAAAAARYQELADFYATNGPAVTAQADRYQGLADKLGVAGEANFKLAEGAAQAATNQDLSAQAAARAAEAQAAAQKSLDDRVTGYYNLATALKDATALEVAQTELQAIQKLFDDGVISQEEYKKATEAVGLAYGIFTPASLAAAAATDTLARLFASGKITAEELAAATGKVQQAAADGQVDLEELGLSVAEHVTPEFANARDQAEKFEGVLDALDGRTVTNTVHTNYTSSGSGLDNYRAATGSGAANGADFIVPPGYPNDSYPLRVESGEHVVVTPASQVSGGGGSAGGGLTVQGDLIINAPGATASQLYDMLQSDDIRRRTGARRS